MGTRLGQPVGPIWTARHTFLERILPEVTKNPYYAFCP